VTLWAKSILLSNPRTRRSTSKSWLPSTKDSWSLTQAKSRTKRRRTLKRSKSLTASLSTWRNSLVTLKLWQARTTTNLWRISRSGLLTINSLLSSSVRWEGSKSSTRPKSRISICQFSKRTPTSRRWKQTLVVSISKLKNWRYPSLMAPISMVWVRQGSPYGKHVIKPASRSNAIGVH